MLPPPDALRFPHPILASRDLRRGATRDVALLGQHHRLARDAAGVPRCTALGDGSPGPALQVLERHRFLWLVAPGYGHDIAARDYSGEGFQQVAALVTRFAAPLHVSFDNFSEDEHTPWVHSFLGWREREAGIVDFEVGTYPDRTEVYYRGIQRPHPLTPTILVRWGDHFHNRWITHLDPPRTVYTLNWSNPRSGATRPVTARFAIYFVAETAQTTLLCTLAFARLERGFRALMPIVSRYVPRIGRSEIVDDMRFVPHVARTPFAFTGMRLGRFDRPLVHNRKLMERIYYGAAPGTLRA